VQKGQLLENREPNRQSRHEIQIPVFFTMSCPGTLPVDSRVREAGSKTWRMIELRSFPLPALFSEMKPGCET
jgi:hypothetical protein